MTGIIRWQEPPASSSGRQGNRERPRAREILKQNPGKWALVEENVSSSAVVAWKKLGCEAVGRRSAKNAKKSDIYARWPVTASTTAQAPAGTGTAAPAMLQPTKPAARAGRATPAKATLPLTTAKPEGTHLNLNDPADRALLASRQRFEADRRSRQNKGRPV